MSHLNIQKLESDTYSKLRLRAQIHGVSIEEEARQIIKQAVNKPIKLGALALDMFGETHGIELYLPEKTPHEPMLFTL